jgi:hypothetical protein
MRLAYESEGGQVPKLARVIFTGAWFLWGISLVVALVSIATYENPALHLGYASRIDFDVLGRGLQSMSSSALLAAATWREWILGCYGVVGLLTLVLTWKTEKSLWRCLVFLLQILTLPWAWLGPLMIPELAFSGVDGEWLAERAPTYVSAGLWVLFASVVILVSFDRGWLRRSKTPAPVAAGSA